MAIVVWAALAVVVLGAALYDVRRYRIPNPLPIAAIALFAVAVAIRPPPDWPWHVATAAGVFAILLVPFALNRLGGGDLKLISALALWSGPQLVVSQVLVTAIAGGAFAALLLVLRRAHRSGGSAAEADTVPPHPLRDGAPIPYGVAIAIGWLVTSLWLADPGHPLHPAYLTAGG